MPVPRCEAEAGIPVTVIAVGTGAASRGRLVMHHDVVVVGPRDDPPPRDMNTPREAIPRTVRWYEVAKQAPKTGVHRPRPRRGRVTPRRQCS